MDNECELQLMYSEKNRQDMWWVVRINDHETKQDYYGPFFRKCNAQKFLDGEL